MALSFERIDPVRGPLLQQAAFAGLDEDEPGLPAHSASAGVRAVGLVFEEYEVEAT
jgi:hypothetical protein